MEIENLENEATAYAYEKVRQNNKKNPCGLCGEVDCEGCEYQDDVNKH